ncbi:MAG: hypothetical protein JXA90_09100 [Planctomycetes bacterium]|nr:hypothetical protein [Planctomycetota bacterium]
MQTFESITAEYLDKLGKLTAETIAAGFRARMTPAVLGGPTHIVPAQGGKKSRKRHRGGPTAWVADSKARRVPTFVITATGGLKKKTDIVASFGQGAKFVKGQALPPMLTAAQRQKLAVAKAS